MPRKTQILDPEVNATVPLNWRTLTEKELRQLKKGKKITVTTLDGLEERLFYGFSETGLVETLTNPIDAGRSLVGRHRVVLYSPQIENLETIYTYDS